MPQVAPRLEAVLELFAKVMTFDNHAIFSLGLAFLLALLTFMSSWDWFRKILRRNYSPNSIHCTRNLSGKRLIVQPLILANSSSAVTRSLVHHAASSTRIILGWLVVKTSTSVWLCS
ncbi:hypothetical protein BDR07DRAFT_448842 [Suillus spraguei]|nr:hypothetical protein BDR07DRAFT_448842 [Suillus spraguei]